MDPKETTPADGTQLAQADQTQPPADQTAPPADQSGQTGSLPAATDPAATPSTGSEQPLVPGYVPPTASTDTGLTPEQQAMIAQASAGQSFMGIPVDALMIGGPIFMIGILVCAWLAGRKDHTEQLSRLDRQRKRAEKKQADKPDAVDIFQKQNENFLGKILSEAGLESQYEQMKTTWILCVLGFSVGVGAMCMFNCPALAPCALIFGPGLGSFGFVQYVKFKGNQRQKQLTAQLPQVLESMVSTLKAGSPVVECFKLLSETAPEPIRSEFKRALVSMQLGKPFRDVIAEMGTRIRTQDFRLLAQAIFISQDVGANLADVVATIAEAIRERFRLRDFLASLTAQGKMTALFIGALPYFITAMTYLATPGYIIPFLNHPIARIVFISMMIWEAIGAYILVKMTTFEV